MAQHAVERSIWINAPRERVWQALTHPDEITIWFSPGVKWHLTGAEVGARLSMLDAETGAEVLTLTLDVFDPPGRLVLRNIPDPPATPDTTTYHLTEENGGTRLTLVHDGYDALPEKIRNERRDQDGVGFTNMLNNIKAHVEGTALPHPDGF
jgi:uncharacterized protein YndB with AHSA1/START domain